MASWSLHTIAERIFVSSPSGISSLEESVGEEMLTVFVPSTPTAFSGYVLVVPRRSVVELPLTVEEAMRLLLTGGATRDRFEATFTVPAGPAMS